VPQASSPWTGPGRRRLLFALLPTLAVATALAAGEAATRLLAPRLDPLRVFLRSPAERANLTDRARVSIFAFDPLLYWRLAPDLDRIIWDFTLVSTNHQGLRLDRPLGRKEPGAVRVVCLGDSVTFGYRVPVVWPERPDSWDRDALPFPALLERWLGAANPGRRIEVVPLAVPGYTSHQGRLWLERDIDRLGPDLVIVLFGWNDATARATPDREAMPPSRLEALARAAASRSQLLLHLLERLAEARERRAEARPRATALPRVDADGFVANHLAIARLARDHGAAVLLVGPVFRHHPGAGPESERIRSSRAALARAAAAAGLPYLEVPELTRPSGAGAALFGEDIHPNHLGHRLLAGRVLAAIAAGRLLPGVDLPATRH
jgi:lysophospholipase L1-like esterase